MTLLDNGALSQLKMKIVLLNTRQDQVRNKTFFRLDKKTYVAEWNNYNLNILIKDAEGLVGYIDNPLYLDRVFSNNKEYVVFKKQKAAVYDAIREFYE